MFRAAPPVEIPRRLWYHSLMETKVIDIYPIPALKRLLAPGQQAYVVGGTVRDFLLGRDVADIDVAVSGDTGLFARHAANATGGTEFVMDEGRGTYRVALKGPPYVQVDICRLKGDILSDLADRDFTINTMAAPLAGGAIIDPHGGMADLGAKVVRALGREAFVDDPLRVMRAFRIAAQLGFDIDAETLKLAATYAPGLSDVSPERVRDELFIILDMDGASGVIARMAERGVLRHVIAETAPMEGLIQGEPHEHDLLNHSLKAMEYAEIVMADLGRWFGEQAEYMAAYLGGAVPGGLSMSGLVKLCALLHDVGKPSCMKLDSGRVRFIGHDREGARINLEIAERLKLSNRAAAALEATALGHMRPLHMSKQGMTRRAVYRYVKDLGDDLPASLIIALADAFATRERPHAMETDVEGVVRHIADYYFGDYRKAREAPLVTGRDLIDELNLTPGPAFSEILDEVEERRAEGMLKDRAGALEYIKRNLAI